MNIEGPQGFQDQDMPLLQATVAEWIARDGRAGYDHIGELPHRIYDNLRHRPVHDLVRVWRHGGVITGIVIAGRFGEAFDALVVPHLRGTAAEVEMLEQGFALTARHLAVGVRHVSTDLFDTDTTRARLLHRLGFQRFRTWDDVNERTLDQLPERLPPAGFTVRAAELADAAALADARNRCFGQDWTAAAYRDGFMRKPGYRLDRETVAISPDGRVAAFAVHWTDEVNRLGHFEPVGTHPDFHRRGLAAAVMCRGMRAMRDAGMNRVTVNNDAQNIAARGLYGSLGFLRVTGTSGYRREVEPTGGDGQGRVSVASP